MSKTVTVEGWEYRMEGDVVLRRFLHPGCPEWECFPAHQDIAEGIAYALLAEKRRADDAEEDVRFLLSTYRWVPCSPGALGEVGRIRAQYTKESGKI